MLSTVSFLSAAGCALLLQGYGNSPRKTGREMFEEISLLPAHLRRFRIEDACADPAELAALCRLLIENRRQARLRARMKVVPGLDAEQYRLMRDAGFESVTLDAVSCSDRLLGRLRIGFTAEDLLAILNHCRDAGIGVRIAILAGHPAEREEDFAESVAFLRRHSGLITGIDAVYCLCNGEYPYLCENDCPRRGGCFAGELPRHAGYELALRELSRIGVPVSMEPPPECFLSSRKKAEEAMLINPDAAFRFEKGGLHAFCRGLSVTGGWGIYTSIFACGSWHDSLQSAAWRIAEKDGARMVLEAAWKTLPLTQIWEALLEGKTLRLAITMKVNEPVFISGEQQLNIMLREEYGVWVNGAERGEFPAGFTGEWVTLTDREAGEGDAIRASGDELPGVSLRCGGGMRLAALNTCAPLNKRILKCQKTDARMYQPGIYEYFKGKITLGGR